MFFHQRAKKALTSVSVAAAIMKALAENVHVQLRTIYTFATWGTWLAAANGVGASGQPTIRWSRRPATSSDA
jgi:hypothetical protein